ncbi:hypothetical protein M9H77_32720 [Catharanthus roseus]|uniref:Uncharacterized protein n=1 Tax=Catharanthus roseus TaxID=4058 RepID=A0ACC0A691_CATRO|nr:hypothetical protein M9H77_32720 [Catharanthus roseus]
MSRMKKQKDMSPMKKQKGSKSDEVDQEFNQWQDHMNINDILYRIFSSFTLLQVTLIISKVCKTWRDVCLTANSWDTLDLSKLNEHFKVPPHPDPQETWSKLPFSKTFWNILTTATKFGNRNLTKIIFNLHISISDEHLIYVAKRCPNVKLLVLPALSTITIEGYQRAFQIWRGLEAVVLPGCIFPIDIFEILGRNCPKLRSLKMTGFVTNEIVFALASYLPQLKAFSIKSSMIKTETLIQILKSLKELEELNMCHSCFVDIPLSRSENNVIDESILEKSTHLKMFYYCKEKNCMTCLAMKGDPLGETSIKRQDLVLLVCIIKQGQSSSMEAEFSSSSDANKWENLPNNVLFHIFSFMSMFDVVMNVSGVCKSLRIASADPTLYKTLDLTLFTTKFRFHPRFLAWSMKDQLSTRFMLFLNNVLNVDRCGNFTKIIFDSCTFLNDDHLIFIAQRTPNLEHLVVLPNLPWITQKGLVTALRLWPKMESISISFYNSNSPLEVIFQNLGLKILTLRCGKTEKEAIKILLEKLKNLEELYVSDKVDTSIEWPKLHLPIAEEDIVQKASRLRKFHACQDGHCISCPTSPFNFGVIKLVPSLQV